MPDQKQSYGQQLAAVAPAFMAKSLIGDLPKGGVEFAVEKKVGGSTASLLSLLRKGLAGRGSGRALGAALGAATAPAYLSGIQHAGSKDSKERRKGLALLGGSAAAFAGMKGLTEGGLESRQAGKGLKQSLSAGAKRGGLKALTKTPQALLMGLTIAKSRQGKGKDSPLNKYLLPAATGALMSSGSRAVETGIPLATKGVSLKNILKAVKAPAAGGAAGGALGGLALAGVTDAALGLMKKRKEKKASGLLGTFGHLIGIHAATKGALRHGRNFTTAVDTPGRLLGIKGTVSGKMSRAKARQMGIGIREGVAGRNTVGFRAAALLNMSVPELRAEREAGQSLGRALRALPKEHRGTALRKLHKVVSRRSLTHTPQGTSTPLIGAMPEGISMALGDKSFYRKSKHLPTFKKIWEKATLGGRGVLGKGLPNAGAVDRHSKVRSLAESGVAGAASLALLSKGVATANPLAVAAGSHGTVGSTKALLAKLPALQRMAKHDTRLGMRFGMGLGHESLGHATKRQLLDLAISPGTSYGQMMGETLGRAARTEASKAVKSKLLKGMTRKKLTFQKAAPTLGAAAATPFAASALVGNNRRSNKK